MLVINFVCIVIVCAIVGWLLVLGVKQALIRARGAFRREVEQVQLAVPAPPAIATTVARVAQLMRDVPDAWEATEHTIEHKPSGVKIWISNGRDYVEFWGVDSPSGKSDLLTKAEKSVLWDAWAGMKEEAMRRHRDRCLKGVAKKLSTVAAE